MFFSVGCQFKFNLLLQIFDGLFTYHLLTLGIPEANPLIANTIDEWGEIWGIVYWKALACVLLSCLFALRHARHALALKALTLTSAVYGSLFLAALYHMLAAS